MAEQPEFWSTHETDPEGRTVRTATHARDVVGESTKLDPGLALLREWADSFSRLHGLEAQQVRNALAEGNDLDSLCGDTYDYLSSVSGLSVSLTEEEIRALLVERPSFGQMAGWELQATASAREKFRAALASSGEEGNGDG